MNNKKRFTLYVILGGTEENMRFRADKVLSLIREDKNPIIFIAALPDEAEWIINYCDSITTHGCIKGPGSWDTLSNVSKEILPFFKKIESRYGGNINRSIVAPTGDSHGKRLMKVFDLVSIPHSYELLVCPLSEEQDGRYEKVPNIFYKMGKPGIYIMSGIAKIFRLKLNIKMNKI